MANSENAVLRGLTSSVGIIPWQWLNDEKWRLYTFPKYPRSAEKKSAVLLARAGFAFIGSERDDSVICAFCRVVKKDWHASDDIHAIHQKMSPCCSMVTGIGCNNVPIAPKGPPEELKWYTGGSPPLSLNLGSHPQGGGNEPLGTAAQPRPI
ncbi:baculoviral IAP repeat-containing protein, partial [Elysia marginata]